MKTGLENSEPIKVLILSDRLIHLAEELANYLRTAGVQIIALETSKDQALMFCDERIDFLIIAGYLKDRKNYNIIEECKNRRLYAVPVIWAMLDALIIGHCSMYRIPLRFERTLPMCDFVLFLQQNRPSHIALPYEENQAIQRDYKPTYKHKEILISRIRTFLRHYLFP